MSVPPLLYDSDDHSCHPVLTSHQLKYSATIAYKCSAIAKPLIQIQSLHTDPVPAFPVRIVQLDHFIRFVVQQHPRTPDAADHRGLYPLSLHIQIKYTTKRKKRQYLDVKGHKKMSHFSVIQI